MAGRLLIINNGLKDLTGHYFETAVSIAEAARKIGYKPLLATHVSCPKDIIPDWLEFCPIFCTDHWMTTPAPLPPDLRGVRGDAAALARVPIEAVRNGDVALGAYLRARLEPIAFSEEPERPAVPLSEEASQVRILPAEPSLSSCPSHLEAPRTALNRPPWKIRWKGRFYALTPPFFVPPLRWLYRQGRPVVRLLRWLYARKRSPYTAIKSVVRGLLPPLVYGELQEIKQKFVHRPPPSQDGPGTAKVVSPQPVPKPAEEAPEPILSAPAQDALKLNLERINAGEEFTHMCTFQRDLERLLCLTGADSGDHVFLPTAHGRELIAIQRLINSLETVEPPRFHLEFRHALDMTGCFDDPNWIHPYTTYHRVFFDYFRRLPHHPRINLYTDTEELSDEYRLFSGLCYNTVPIPFRSSFLTTHSYQPGDPLCLSFFGDVRDEKGFFWLPDLIDALMEDFIAPGKVWFVVQGSMGKPEWNPKSYAALLRLKEMPSDYVTIVGADGPLSPDDYYRLVSETDMLLCPYSAQAYRRRSSGTLTEAIAAGIPTIVPRGTWLEHQQFAGTGETFTDLASFIAGVRRLCEHYPGYLKCAQAYKERWLAVHSPDNLVKVLVRRAAEPACPRARKVA